MNCPKCNVELASFSAEGVDMDLCDQCGGVWFDKGELAFYTETSEDVPAIGNAIDAGRQVNCECPRCDDVKLVETRFVEGSDLLVDICPRCKGVFLDKGELKRVEQLSVDRDMLGKVGRALGQLRQRGYEAL